MASIVAPGSLLSASATAAAGLGAYTLDGRVFASRCGKVEVATVTDDGGGPTTTTRYSVVSSPRRRIGGSASSRVPAVGDVVIGRVERVNPRFAKLVIVCVGNAVLSNQFQGLIQVLDIRAYEKDKVAVYDSFRPNDIVRAEVISLGDSRSYFLTTAKDTLGVVYARSIAGAAMVPLSWNEMVCPVTKSREPRKIARVVDAVVAEEVVDEAAME